MSEPTGTQMTAIDDAASYAISALQHLQQLVSGIGEDTTNVNTAITAIQAAVPPVSTNGRIRVSDSTSGAAKVASTPSVEVNTIGNFGETAERLVASSLRKANQAPGR